MKKFSCLCVALFSAFSFLFSEDARAGTTPIYGSPLVINGSTNMYAAPVGAVGLPSFTLQVILPSGLAGTTNQAAYTVYASFNTNINGVNITNALLLGTYYPSSTSPGTYNFVQSAALQAQIYVGIATTNTTTNYVNIVQ